MLLVSAQSWHSNSCKTTIWRSCKFNCLCWLLAIYPQIYANNWTYIKAKSLYLSVLKHYEASGSVQHNVFPMSPFIGNTYFALSNPQGDCLIPKCCCGPSLQSAKIRVIPHIAQYFGIHFITIAPCNKWLKFESKCIGECQWISKTVWCISKATQTTKNRQSHKFTTDSPAVQAN